MKKIDKSIIKLVIAFYLFLSTGLWAATTVISNSPIGYWKTIDDVTNKPKVIIQISETSDHVLIGRIVKIYSTSEDNKNKLCSACEGSLHNQEILGMMIINHLTLDKDNPEVWEHGSILDLHNGKTYRCNVELLGNNHRLLVRSYLGLPLLGRTETWMRVSALSGA